MTIKPAAECSYYLVREMGGEGIRAKDVFFNDMLQHIRSKGLSGIGLSYIEIDALVMAAHERGRIDELDAAVEAGKPMWRHSYEG